MTMVTNGTTLACPACTSPKTRQFLAGSSDQWRQIQRRFTYYICQDCRLRFQGVLPEEAKRLFADVQDVAPRIHPRRRRELRCEEDVLQVFRKLGLGRRLLDIGSGDGDFLSAARKSGFDCLGTDVSARLAEVARSRSGSEVLVGDLADLDLPSESFDIINLDSVLMYVSEPRDLMLEVARLLRPGGVCRIHEFDPDSLIGRLKGRHYWLYAPTHVNVWTRKSIVALGAAAGMTAFRTFSGTEASLSNWLATGLGGGLWVKSRDIVVFVMRRFRLFNFGIGGDTVYYLRRFEQRG